MLKPKNSLFRSMTKVLHVDPATIDFPTQASLPKFISPATLRALQAASECLRQSKPVVFPTETVYGLAAPALDPLATSRIFAAKGRPQDNPLIVHISSTEMLRRLVPERFAVPASYEILMRQFWPGPLTLLFPRDEGVVPAIVCAGSSTVAVRMPSHPVARALIAISDAPLAAPSANASGRPSPTKAEHVLRDLRGKVDLILDGGPCQLGLESTVVDGLGQDGALRLLRPGGVTVEDIERVLREDWEAGTRGEAPRVLVHHRDFRDEELERAPTTPGMKYRHYSPSVPVVLLRSSSPPDGTSPTPVRSYLSSLADSQTERPLRIGLLSQDDSPLTAMPTKTELERYSLGPSSDLSIASQRLFDGLLSLEQRGVDLILVEEVKPEREGLAFMNRVQKAARESVWITF